MKKSNPNKQVTNIYFNSSNHSSKSRKPNRSHAFKKRYLYSEGEEDEETEE